MYFIQNILYKKTFFIVVGGGDALLSLDSACCLLISKCSLHSSKSNLYQVGLKPTQTRHRVRFLTHLRNDLFFLNKLYFIYRSEEKRKVWTTHSFLMHSQLAKVIAPGSHYLAIEVEEVTQMLMIRTLRHNTTHHGNDMMFMLSSF